MNVENDSNAIESVESLRAKLEEQGKIIAALNIELQNEKEKSKNAEEMSRTDFLTGLKNRRGMEEAAKYILPEAIAEGHADQRKGEKKITNGAVLYLDIDHFKEINDQYGHPIGNRIIQEAAAFLTRSMRPNDVVARAGGDEFVVILNGATEKIIEKFFDRSTDPPQPRFGFTTSIDGREQRISFSGGIALVQPKETVADLNQMIDRADKALYQSKAAGLDRITMFTPMETSSDSDNFSAYKTQE